MELNALLARQDALPSIPKVLVLLHAELRNEEVKGGATGWRAARPARWWESKLKTQHVKHTLDAPPRDDAAWYSEYSLTQHHNDV